MSLYERISEERMQEPYHRDVYQVLPMRHRSVGNGRLIKYGSRSASLQIEHDLEIAPIGWQLFILGSSQNNCTAFLTML